MISCILLAAGESSRFGSPKPLAKIATQTVIEYSLFNLLETKISEIIIVLGAKADKISPYILKNSRIKNVLNKNHSLGQTSSFKTALEAVNPNSKGIMLLPIDMPFVKPQTINFLIDTFLEKKCLMLIPAYEGKNGHPSIFSEKLFQEFKNLKNETPLFTIQRKYENKILKLPVDDIGVTQSFNTPQELKELLIVYGL